MIRLCGASMGLLAFAVTLLAGLLAGNGLEVVVLRGVWAMFVFCGLGLGVGWVAYRVTDEHAVGLHRKMWPEEAESDEGDEATGARGETSPVAGA